MEVEHSLDFGSIPYIAFPHSTPELGYYKNIGCGNITTWKGVALQKLGGLSAIKTIPKSHPEPHELILWSEAEKYSQQNVTAVTSSCVIRCKNRPVQFVTLYKYIGTKRVKKYTLNTTCYASSIAYYEDGIISVRFSSNMVVIIFEMENETKCIKSFMPHDTALNNIYKHNNAYLLDIVSNNLLYGGVHHLLYYKDSKPEYVDLPPATLLLKWGEFILIKPRYERTRMSNMTLLKISDNMDVVVVRHSPLLPNDCIGSLVGDNLAVITKMQFLLVDINFNLLKVVKLDQEVEKIVDYNGYPVFVVVVNDESSYFRHSIAHIDNGQGGDEKLLVWNMRERRTNTISKYNNSIVTSTGLGLRVWCSTWSTKNHFMQPRGNRLLIKLMYLIKSRHKLFSYVPFEILNIILSFAYSF